MSAPWPLLEQHLSWLQQDGNFAGHVALLFKEPQQFYHSVYLQTDPFVSGCWLCVGFAAVTYVLSILTDHYSYVDKIWSIVPAVYTLNIWVLSKDTFNTRVLVILLLAAVWGVRLTYNFARKGGYQIRGGEDYRWAIIRSKLHWTVWQLFNITFIAAWQNLLLYALVWPAYAAYLEDRPWTALDTAGTVAAALCILGETIADEQQWRFHCEKHQYLADSKSEGAAKLRYASLDDVKRGFLTRGLFRYSRHPNFFCEMSLWWSLYLLSVAPTGNVFNWTLCGPVALTSLFQGSTWLTELITASKYSQYKEYQRVTSRIVPLWPGRK